MLLRGKESDTAQPTPREVQLRIRPLDGRSIVIREGTSDADVLWETYFGRYHLPPCGFRPRTIWDLGANIGLTMAHMAQLYPDARLIGVELDEENAGLCARNVSAWGERCKVLNAAIWDRDGRIEYRAEPGLEYGFSVGPREGQRRTASALTLNRLAAIDAMDTIDYVKMDIEGAERRVLRSQTDWARRVRCIMVEVHEPYSIADCLRDLDRLGFSTEVDSRHWASVMGGPRPRPHRYLRRRKPCCADLRDPDPMRVGERSTSKTGNPSAIERLVLLDHARNRETLHSMASGRTHLRPAGSLSQHFTEAGFQVLGTSVQRKDAGLTISQQVRCDADRRAQDRLRHRHCFDDHEPERFRERRVGKRSTAAQARACPL